MRLTTTTINNRPAAVPVDLDAGRLLSQNEEKNEVKKRKKNKKQRDKFERKKNISKIPENTEIKKK